MIMHNFVSAYKLRIIYVPLVRHNVMALFLIRNLAIIVLATVLR